MNIPNPEPKKRLLIIKSESVPIITQSPIPNTLTREILTGFEGSNFPSTILESFLISKLNSGNLDFTEEEILQLEADVADLYEKSKFLLSEMQSSINFSDIQNMVMEMVLSLAERLGANDVQLAIIKKVNISIDIESGYSAAGNNNIRISLIQIARKVLDLTMLLQIPTEVAFELLLKRVIAHELGHIIDDALNLKSNSVPSDINFAEGENRSERFAEFIAEATLTEAERQVNRAEKKINVFATSNLYAAIEKYNTSSADRIGVFQLFAKLKSKIKNPSTLSFLESRQILYSTAVPENYAKPYEWIDFPDQIKPNEKGLSS
jgi:hypothetical protein